MTRSLSCVAWNVQSIRNKCDQVLEHTIDYNADVVFLSETWMEADKNDITALIKERGYKLLHDRRTNREKEGGGGVGIMVKSCMVHKHLSCKPFSSFEHTMVEVKLTNSTKLVLITIYRLLFVPPHKFLDEFSDFLEMLSVMKENFVMAGDINLHLENDDSHVNSLNETFEMFNLQQYVDFPTHNLGHTLDLVVARGDGPCIRNVKPNNVHLSDHFMVTFEIEEQVVKHEERIISFRNFKSTDVDQFMVEVKERYESSVPPGDCTMGERVKHYNDIVRESVNSAYPLISKKIKIVPDAPWFDNEYKQLRKQRRKAEKKYKKTKQEADKEKFKTLRKDTCNLALKKKKEYTTRKIDECKVKTKALFSCVNRLLDIKQDSVLPSHDSELELADRFVFYFKEKIDAMRNSFSSDKTFSVAPSQPFDGVALERFEPATEDEIQSIVSSHGIKCSADDPIPAKLLKQCYRIFIPIWLELVNLSLSEGSMDCLKSALVAPLIKEMDRLIDCDILKNFRPVSNLQFLSKLIERVVKKRLCTHMDTNRLNCKNQHGYKDCHCTEMLLAKVTNDLLLGADKKTPTVLMFLDLSAAFDTVDHEKLLSILESEIGVKGVALKWFCSFLKGRTQRVKVGDVLSSEVDLDFGVPQGSILGPPLFNIYTRSFPNTMIKVEACSIEGYADDHQIWEQFNVDFQIVSLGENLDDCFQTFEAWMKEFFLKLNPSKTKIMVVAPPGVRKEIVINGTFLSGKCVRFVQSAKNLGVLLDEELSFECQINKVVSSCFSTIRLLSRIKHFFDTEQLKTLVCSLIFSILDYCNVLYYGVNSVLIKKLQRVQNSAARLVCKVNRFDHRHSDDMFFELHWLKIRERIVFKILLIIHKCVNNVAPEELCDLVEFVKSDRTRRLKTPRCNGQFGERALSICGPKLWNALPLSLRLETCTDDFKKSLKTFLFTNAERFYDVAYMK